MQTLFLLSSFLIVVSFASAESGKAAFRKAAGVVRDQPPHYESSESRHVSTYGKRQSSPYLNNVTQKFVVNGAAIPDVNFDVGESYAGLLPISGAANETRELYFWFFPSTNPAASDEITIWFNGGPGCSSLSGLLTENGPFEWMAGTFAPTQNAYSWTNLTNMLWVEQPVGVGFTQGKPNITNEVELGSEFIGFYKQFVDAFNVHGRKVYLTGESYAGYYVPYIADSFISADDLDYYNLAGVGINDPIIGDGNLQQEIPVVPFADYWSELLYLNESFITSMHATADSCGYTDYFTTYLQFPPPGPFPTIPEPPDACDTFDIVADAATLVNPCFNIYHITDTCPHLWSVLGKVNRGDYVPPGSTVYFNRSDVQAAINAPVGTNWAQCNSGVFLGREGDQSLGPAQDGVLQRVIEYTNNTIIGSGNLDYILNTNGTLLAIQNMTWNGVQGFETDPRSANEFYIPNHPEYNGGSLSASGVAGNWAHERGLTFYSIQLAGHELPGYAPGAGYRMLEKLLGRIDNFAEMTAFTTQSGVSNYTTNGIKMRV